MTIMIDACRKHFEYETQKYRNRTGRTADIAIVNSGRDVLVSLEDQGKQVSFRWYKVTADPTPGGNGWCFSKANCPDGMFRGYA